MRMQPAMSIATLLTAALLALCVPLSQGVAAHPVLRPHANYRSVCSTPKPGRAACLAEVVTGEQPADIPPYGPSTFHTAYNLPCAPLGSVQTICPRPATFGPETIGIVDAGGDPGIQHDLGVFDRTYGLPKCTARNGCLEVRNQDGGTTLPAPGGWQLEIALDVETAHGLCQTCRILLIETQDAAFTSLAGGVDTAVGLGATVVSNSYGGPSTFDDPVIQHAYDHAGVAIVAGTGDSGYGTESPAGIPSVIAAGGTSLWTNGDGSYATESAWIRSGSGCYLAPARKWQRADSLAVGCNTFRSIADVSADADPTTGAHIYSSSWGDVAGTGWARVGGTSLSSPIIAAAIALAGGIHRRYPAREPYIRRAHFRDVTVGANGNCGTALCISGPGYDGPTGLGSPLGIAAFGGSPAPPTPVPTDPSVPPTPFPTTNPTPTASPPAPPLPTATSPATHQAACQAQGDLQDCSLAWVDLLNAHRASVGVAPLQYDAIQSAGAGSCVGSQGHSQAMADSGSIWHTNSQYAAASFPNDLCESGWSTAGENVGEAGGSTWDAIAQVDALMWSEPSSPGCSGNHACNIRDGAYTRVGVGIAQSGGYYFLTTDFEG